MAIVSDLAMSDVLLGLMLFIMGWIKLDLVLLGKKIDEHREDHSVHAHRRREDLKDA